MAKRRNQWRFRQLTGVERLEDRHMLAVLSNAPGDGTVSVTVDGFGAYGSSLGSFGGNATYDPVGSTAANGTTFLSGVSLQINGTRQWLATGPVGTGFGTGLANPATTGSAAAVSSSFVSRGLNFELEQALTELFVGAGQGMATRSGSLLTQTYRITNTTAAPLTFDLYRYVDGDLQFDSSISDGGGRLPFGNSEILFETDSATGSATEATFVGITAEGGFIPTTGRYEISGYSGLRTKIQNNTALGNSVLNDGADADQFVDSGRGYDMALALHNQFVLQPGASDVYVTRTIFGTGNPDALAQVASLSLAPDVAERPATTSHSVNATALDAQGHPVVGARIEFMVTGTNPTTGFSFTDFNGVATFTYSGANAGLDTIHATAGLSSSQQVNVNWLPIPNLVVSNPIGPDIARRGSSINLGWTVSNADQGIATAPWSDSIYLSTDSTFDAGDVLLEGGIQRAGDLASGEKYDQTRMVTIPASTPLGNYFLLFVADATNTVYERSSVDNIVSHPIQITLPDLVVDTPVTVGGGGSAVFGSAVNINWSTRNQGLVEAVSSSIDRIWLSTDATLDGGDRNLASVTTVANIPLSAGGSYSNATSVLLPLLQALVPGTYYFIVETDATNSEPETSNSNNWRASVPVTITAPPLPDLVVDSIIAPTNALSNGAIPLSWTIRNNGSGPVSGTFQDRVYLSADSTIGSDTIYGTFEFQGTILPGQTITRTQNITLPPAIEGNYYVVVTTDIADQVFEQHGRESNNSTIDDQPIDIDLAPFPNLVVDHVITPATANSGQQAVVEWVVTNHGNGATSVPSWSDNVYLSLDQSVDSSDRYLGSVVNPSFLSINDSYRSSLAFTLPNGINDNYYFIVVTDAGQQMLELNAENDNTRAGGPTNIMLTPPPDLQVTQAQAPTATFSEQTINVSWTVTNKGQGDTRQASWYDRVYMSSDTTIGAGDQLLATVIHNGALNSSETYLASATFSLPIGVSGPFYFLVQTDAGNNVYEHGFENNNVGFDVVPTTVNLIPPPDLEVELVDAPLYAIASRSLSVSFRVTNNGSTVTPNSSWQDRFYLSANTTLEATDLLLQSKNHIGDLEPGENYSDSFTVTLPDDVAGAFYAIVATDAGNVVFELNNDNNIEFDATPIAITSLPADLIVSSITGPSAAEAGKSILVDWTVANNGIGDTVVATWMDRLFLSVDGSLSNDDLVLTTVNHNGILTPAATYEVSKELVTIPFEVTPGNYFLIVSSDYGNSVYEGANNGNNTSAATPIAISRRESDLRVTAVTAPATVLSGGPISVNWTVTNASPVATNATYWYDDVYLSADNVIDAADVHLGSVQHSNALEPNSNYSASRQFTLPRDLTGQYFVIVRTDVTNRVIEGPFEENNDRATPGSGGTGGPEDGDVNISLSTVPDLVLESVNAPTAAISGQPLEVHWTVRNDGPVSATGSWFDAVYLSQDQVFDRNSDTYLGYANRPSDLTTGASYNQTSTFSIPAGVAGIFWVFVAADSSDRIYERGAEFNNSSYDTSAVLISHLPPADFVVGTITVPLNGVSGQTASITYTVNNQGQNPARGTWVDSVYLSPDDTWDVNDAFVGRMTNNNVEIPGGGSYTRTLTAPLPGVVPDDYRVIIRSDIRNTIPESIESNNIGVSLNRFEITIPELHVGTPSTGTLNFGQEIYYRIEVPDSKVGEAIVVNLDVDNPNTANHLYARFGQLPSRSAFDFSFSEAFASDQRVVIPSARAGTYYILVVGDPQQHLAGPLGNYSIDTNFVQFSIFNTSFGQGGTAGNRTIEVDGVKFDRTVTARLSDGAGFEMLATTYYRTSETKLFATFDLSHVRPGTYDIIFEKPTSGEVMTVDGGLEVLPGGGGDNKPSIDAPTAYTRRWHDPPGHFPFTVSWFNGGINDAPVPLIQVQSNEPFAETLEVLLNGGGAASQTLYGVIQRDGPAGILIPGDNKSLTLISLALGLGSGERKDFQFNVSRLYKDAGEQFDWGWVRQLLFANGIDALYDNAEAIFDMLSTGAGSTNGDFLTLLSHYATLMPKEFGDNTNLLDILDLAYSHAAAQITTSITGVVRAPSFSVDISGQDLVATNLESFETFSTTTLNDGSFVLPAVTAGTYEFRFGGAPLQNAFAVRVTDGEAIHDVVLNAIPGETLTGEVRDTEGAIIEGATIIAQRVDGASLYLSQPVRSDESGDFSVNGLEPGAYRLFVSALGFQTKTIDNLAVNTGMSVNVTVDLAATTTVTGIITSSRDGALIEGALVALVDRTTGYGIDVVRTGADGAFVAFAPAGVYDVVVSHSGYRTSMLSAYEVNSDGPTVTVDIALSPSSTVSGTLMDSFGTPLIGATIELLDVDSPGEGEHVVTSTSAGTFFFDSISAGSYQLRATNNAALLAETTIHLSEGESVVADLVSDAIGTVVGTVIDNAGNADRSANVFVYFGEIKVLSTTTNADGHFAVMFAKPGRYHIIVESDRGVYSQLTVDAPLADSVVAHSFIAGQRSVSGTVVDSLGNGIPNTPVVVSTDQDATGQNRQVRVQTDELGRYSVNGLGSGKYIVSAGPTDTLHASEVTIVVGDGDLNGVTLALSPAAIVSGIVTDGQSGNAISFALISVYELDTDKLVGIIGADVDGHFVGLTIESGSYDLVVIAQDKSAYTLEQVVFEIGDNSVVIALEDAGLGNVVTGKVSSTSPGLEQASYVIGVDPLGRVIAYATVEENGAYALTGLPSEEITVIAGVNGVVEVSRQVDLSNTRAIANINFILDSAVIAVDVPTQSVVTPRISTITAPPGWGDDWWDDARRKIPELGLEKPTEPECEEQRPAYERALRAFEAAELARKLAVARQDVLYWDSWLKPPQIIGSTATIASKISLGYLVLGGVKIPMYALGVILGVDVTKMFITTEYAGNKADGAATNYVRVATGLDPSIGRDSALIASQATETAGSSVAEGQVRFIEGILKFQQNNMSLDLVRGNRWNRAQQAMIARLNLAQSASKALALLGKVFAGLDAIVSTGSEFTKLQQLGDEIGTQWAHLVNEVAKYLKAVEAARNAISEYEATRQNFGNHFAAVDDLTWKTEKNQPFTPGGRGVLTNDIGKDCGDIYVASWNGNVVPVNQVPVSGGELTGVGSSGSFTYVPTQDFVGTASFVYTVAYRDAEGREILVGSARVNIEVVDCEGLTTKECCEAMGYDDCDETEDRGSEDPNDISGPDGFGAERWVTSSQPLHYTIRFENDAELANAPAQVVSIEQTLDPDVDPRTFRLGAFGFGQVSIAVPENTSYYHERIDLTQRLGIFVDVIAGVDIAAGRAFWSMTAEDPETGDVPTNPLVGFLPPNNDGTGEGYVNYSVVPMRDSDTGAVIDAEARIIFDINPPIDTPSIFNTVDADRPTSSVATLTALAAGSVFDVSWSGADIAGGSGLADFTIYVSENGGSFHTWLANTTLTSAQYVGEAGKRYAFYSVARDNAGNIEASPAAADAFTITPGPAPKVTGFVVQEGLTQRSYVDRFVIDFLGEVNLRTLIASGSITNAITIINLGVYSDTMPDQLLSLTPAQFRYEFNEPLGRSRLTWSLDAFAGSHQSLPDGYFQVSLNASLITDLISQGLDGNGDGIGGDSFSFALHRLSGDTNGDRSVNTTDMSLVNGALGSRPGVGTWNANADLDRDGVVTTRDRLIVSRGTGNSIVPPTTVGLPGDYNRDGSVDAADYIVWRHNLGVTGLAPAGDGDNNGIVDNNDLLVWRQNFGSTALLLTASTLHTTTASSVDVAQSAANSMAMVSTEAGPPLNRGQLVDLALLGNVHDRDATTVANNRTAFRTSPRSDLYESSSQQLALALLQADEWPINTVAHIQGDWLVKESAMVQEHAHATEHETAFQELFGDEAAQRKKWSRFGDKTRQLRPVLA